MDLEWNVVVQIRESNAVLGANRLSNDDLVDVVELIPVLISTQHTARHSYSTNYITAHYTCAL